MYENNRPKFFIYIVPETLTLERFHMERPKRQAAQDAIVKIRDIREWETLPESSKRFKECAARIDAELEFEIKKNKVKTCDLDISDPGEKESGDDFYDADDGFVVADKKILDTDPDFKVNEDEENMSENVTEDGISSQGCDEGPAEDLLSNVTEKDELTGDEWEDESGDESENESEDESEDEAGDEQWEDAQEHFQTEPSIVVQCEPVQAAENCEPVQAAENCEPVQSVQCEQVQLQL
jgi:hypothetical protein